MGRPGAPRRWRRSACRPPISTATTRSRLRMLDASWAHDHATLRYMCDVRSRPPNTRERMMRSSRADRIRRWPCCAVPDRASPVRHNLGMRDSFDLNWGHANPGSHKPQRAANGTLPGKMRQHANVDGTRPISAHSRVGRSSTRDHALVCQMSTDAGIAVLPMLQDRRTATLDAAQTPGGRDRLG